MICIEALGLHSVIVIDDHVDTADIMTLALQEHDFLAVPAYSGAQGLALVEQIRPSTVILDLDMPGMSGLQVCGRIRSAPWGASVRIIVISGWAHGGHRQAAKDAGCDVFLAKPAAMPEVLSAIVGELLMVADVGHRSRPRPAQPDWSLGEATFSGIGSLPVLSCQGEGARQADVAR